MSIQHIVAVTRHFLAIHLLLRFSSLSGSNRRQPHLSLMYADATSHSTMALRSRLPYLARVERASFLPFFFTSSSKIPGGRLRTGYRVMGGRGATHAPPPSGHTQRDLNQMDAAEPLASGETGVFFFFSSFEAL